MHPRTSVRLSRRALALASAVLVCLSLLAASAPAASANPTGVFTVEHFVRYQSVNSTTANVASGDSFRYIVNYTCTNDVCAGGTLSIPFPTGYNIANPSYSTTHLTNLARTDNALVFTIAPNLDPGTTGQIDVEASTTGGLTPDGATFAQAATISTGSQPDAVSATVTVTARAASNTPVTITRTAGGSRDDVSRYSVLTCNSPTGAPNTGQLQVLAGSTLTVHLPSGAVIERAGGGTISGTPPSLSWTLGMFPGGGCGEQLFTVSFPDSDLANGLGASKTVTADWDRTLFSQAASTSTGTRTDTLGAPTVSLATNLTQSTPYGYGTAPVNKVDYGTTATYEVSASNNGVGTLTTADVELVLPAALFATAITARNPGQGPATVYATTTCGPDRVDGTSDDGQEEPFATVAAAGMVSAASTTATWPNSSTALDTSCFVTRVRVQITNLWPADGAQVLAVATQPRNPDRNGAATAHGDDLTIAMTGTGVNAAGTANTSGSVQTEINGPPPPPPTDPNTYVTVRTNSPGQLPAGVMQGNASTTAIIGNLPLPKPVIAVMLPPNVSLVSWTGHDEGNGVPTPTLTQVPDYDGAGFTLLRWTFPTGVSLPVGFGYRINYTVERNEFAYGSLNMPIYVHGADTTQPPRCRENFFGSSPDTFDVDLDGDTTEHGCLWPADMSVAAAASASITTRIKGSFDPSYVAGPATGQTAPGSNDNYRVDLKNSGTTELDQLVVIEKLPRPGDTKTISAGARNTSTRTFPVVLRGTPSVPTLPTDAVLSWSDVTGACQPELGYSPSGCNAPAWRDWITDPPTDVGDVLLIKVEFGSNVLKPGVVWSITIPVTTPTTGATEPDRADFNPDPVNVANEKAVNTVAFKGQRKDISTALAATEPPGVTLEVPGALGPVGPAPTPSAISTTGTATASHTATVTPPSGGAVYLLDGITPVTTLVVTGVGTYSVDPTTGALTFQPVLGYSGAHPVGYRVFDSYGQPGESIWTATVDPPAGPTAGALTSTGPVRTAQTATVTVPANGSVRLLDGSMPVNSLAVTGVGTYVVNPSTGVITFTPSSTFRGTPPPIDFVVEDAYAQTANGTYTPTVSLGALTASPLTSQGVATAVHTTTIPVPPNGGVRFLNGGTPATTLSIPGEGTYVIVPSTGVVTFTPVLGFSGPGTTLSYERTDDFGQSAISTYRATVAKPAPPTAPSANSGSTPEEPLAPQRVTVAIPPLTSITLVDPDGNEVTSVTINGQGTYVLDPTTGEITFTPVDGFAGPSSRVAVRLTDAYGQPATGAYTTTIAERPVTNLPVRNGTPGPRPSVTIVVPPGGSITLVAPDGTEATTVSVAGQGTYTLEPSTGEITFTPVDGFVGPPTPVTYRVTAADGSTSQGTFAPTVLGAETTRGSTPPTEAGSAAPSRLAFTGGSLNLALLGGLLMFAGIVILRPRRRRA